MQFAEGGRIDGSVKWAEPDLGGCYIPYAKRDKRAREILAEIAAQFEDDDARPDRSASRSAR